MFEVEPKLELFFNNELWERAIQHCIDKGIKPLELSEYTTAEFRAYLAEVMLAGEYKVAPPHIALIPKETKGEFRKVYVNTVLDRLVLTIINEVYCTFYGHLIHPKCVSYKKGVGVRTIIENIVREITSSDKTVVGYKVDISKYFDSVSRETMNAVLKSVDSGSCLDQILYDYYNDDIIMDENGVLIEKYKSLCQGCAPSAFFANLTLREVDYTLDKICSVYYRYSDDLLILGEKADEAMSVLTAILETKGLKINPKKVESITKDGWFTFLGCKIKGNQVSLGKKSLTNFVNQVSERTKLPKDKEHRHGCSEVELRRAIKNINQYLYTAYLKNSSEFGWGEYFFGIINCEEDIVTMDTWLKDMLRGYFTGKGGCSKVGGLGSVDTEKEKTVLRGKGRCVVKNLGKTETILEECGYVSMHHLYKVYRISKDVYRSEIKRLMLV